MTQSVYRTPKGTHDVLPEDHIFMTYIKKAVRHRARQAGYKRIETPMFENRTIFERGIGEHTDIVEKELFMVSSKHEDEDNGPEFALRPEFTASICRSYIEHGMQQLPQPVELYAIGPCFRHDRPQKGRYRQFNQFDFEIIGLKDPSLDAQLIHVLSKILDDLKILKRLRLQINNIGTPESRKAYLDALKDFFIGKERNLPALDRSRLETNPLRLLDSKEEDTQILLKSAPTLDQFLDDESKQYHETVLEYLGALGIQYEENSSLVRGLDYYTQTVFEYWDETTGAQNAVGGGGRYDRLMELLGGKDTPGIGFACGMERIAWQMAQTGVKPPNKDQVDVFVAQLGPEAKKTCLMLISQLREKGVHTIGALGEASLKSQMRLADKFGARYTLLLGQMEVKEGVIILRDMAAGKQKQIPFKNAIPEVTKLIGERNLDTYTIKDKIGDTVDED
ncbi:histidine--tRNA ligase [Candidatus Peribacteria bacterium RIFOXYC1_FULL_54_13]|nr:MAG: Histidine-tRNA ligase [Candidatus Peribacteria bacterium GW2011_GWB1_54_5]KKW44102.1 MAG: Histidine-tRNA ligase [Candidatus Peregrinibacteria bacterium GW2011_GWA2_54_9]OGJ72215.1 MAG: histidine--tRNA ligase [Candidatus Peribacteria bacterium RIFOXYA1_FULL_56_14]OGJ73584.1 MAG: histidine--tRNA ligase [Candidatus Peribacteria bacterium RIFOXYA2_FULL_55_28]OGJ75788.1 MAG: histidine--tRNA ligase [Candidatus Peribacteria bacterium RIFOXYB1_FULL_54_35]OGJ76993.1 MAG: histidine--tRNA ligase 